MRTYMMCLNHECSLKAKVSESQIGDYLESLSWI
jgi:hypothetical protein